MKHIDEKNSERFITLKVLCSECNSELRAIRLDFDMLAMSVGVSGECEKCGLVSGTIIDENNLIELSKKFWEIDPDIDPSDEE